jgi:hypothetical protein
VHSFVAHDFTTSAHASAGVALSCTRAIVLFAIGRALQVARSVAEGGPVRSGAALGFSLYNTRSAWTDR